VFADSCDSVSVTPSTMKEISPGSNIYSTTGAAYFLTRQEQEDLEHDGYQYLYWKPGERPCRQMTKNDREMTDELYKRVYTRDLKIFERFVKPGPFGQFYRSSPSFSVTTRLNPPISGGLTNTVDQLLTLLIRPQPGYPVRPTIAELKKVNY
jgi:hypothetical protein